MDDLKTTLLVNLKSNSKTDKQINKKFRLMSLFYNRLIDKLNRAKRRYYNHLQYKEIKYLNDQLRGKKCDKKSCICDICIFRRTRNELTNIIKKETGYRNFRSGFENFCLELIKKVPFKGLISSYEAQEIGERAFDASEKLFFKRNQYPRFVGRKNELKTIWVKTKQPKNGLPFYQFKPDHNGSPNEFCLGSKSKITFNVKKSNYKFKQNYDKCDKLNEVVRGLITNCKHGIKREKIRGKVKYKALVVGTDLRINIERNLGIGSIYGDWGLTNLLSFIHKNIDGELTPHVFDLSTEYIKKIDKKIASLNRLIARSQRINNPLNYEDDTFVIKGRGLVRKQGKIKKNSKSFKKVWIVSKRCRLLKNKIADLERKLRAYRKQGHYRIARVLRSMGDKVVIEKRSNLKGIQKLQGRLVKRKGLGQFLTILKDVFGQENVKEHNTFETKHSQTCPSCRKVVKKNKKEYHLHNCICGFKGDRDTVAALNVMLYELKSSDIERRKICEDFLDKSCKLQIF
jgi:hypothetical protein